MVDRAARLAGFPAHGWIGLGLVAVIWPANWILSASAPVTAYLFFPLWLGYALAIDAVNLARRGTSLLERSVKKYVGLFLVSAPAWWLFEVLNWRMQNWRYEGRELFTDVEYFFFSSLSFSTVIPAVFGTAEFIAGTRFGRRAIRGPRLGPDARTTRFFALLGLITFALMIAWPNLFFPFFWLSLYFILAPVNVWLGHRSLSERTRHGDWRPVVALWLGTLICGFFWEMWNWYSYPKWIYVVPWADFLHVFEMPLLGYGGYPPFGMEIFALYHLVVGLLGGKRTDYVTAGLFHNE
ncbi:MAG TPA: hypothetical protein VMN57_08780 [Anaerolineales bacterium]|nr:hypothetical protein [Anaerolineales bacterium]